VGNVGTVSGVAGVALGPVQRGVAIWAKYVNAHGGINGRKVALKVADDNSNSADYQRYVKQMVEKDHVVAFLGNEDAQTESTSTLKYLESKNVPLVGTDTGSAFNYSSRVVFPQASAGIGYTQMSIAVWVKQGLKDGKSKHGLVTCQEVDACNTVYSNFDSLVRKYGGDPVYKGQTSLGAPSLTSECLAAVRAGVQVLAYVGDPNSLTRLASSCRSQGYKGTFAAPGSIVIGSQAQDPNLDGTYINTNVTPWPLAVTAEQKAFQEAFSRYSGADGQPAGGDMVGWVSGRLLEAALRGATGTITGQTIMNGLYKLRGDTLNGLTGPLTFRAGKPATPIACGSVVFIRGGKFAGGGDGRLTCY
jgi:branched-chain amino acid transport system substrate-binding protein